jgi:hypothetical protein
VAEIITFRLPEAYVPAQVSIRGPHAVGVQILDSNEPEETRWRLQRLMQRAASFRCLKNFKDEVARQHQWHRFTVTRTRLLRRFLREVQALVLAGRVAVKVDGVRVRPAMGKAA